MYCIQKYDKPNICIRWLKIIKLEGNKIYIPLENYEKQNKQKKTEEKLAIKTSKIFEKLNSKKIVLSKEIKKYERYTNILNTYQLDIINGKWLFSMLIPEITQYIEIKKELKPEETTIHILVNDFTEIAIENIKKLDKVKQDLEYASDMCTEVISIYTTMDIPQLSNDEYTKMLIDARNDVKTAYELREKAMESAITLINTKNPKYIGKITEYLNLSDNYIANFKDRLTDLNQIIDEQ